MGPVVGRRPVRVCLGLMLMAVAVGQAIALQRVGVATGGSEGRPLVPSSSAQAAFEPNLGQTAPDVRFVLQGRSSQAYLTAGGETVLALRRASLVGASQRDGTAAAVLRIRPLGADPAAAADATRRAPGVSNYLMGDRWTRNVPRYSVVRYRAVYPGIDLVYTAHADSLEYDFVVAPGATPETIRLGFEGQDRLAVSGSGDLVVHTGLGPVTHRRPVLYQESGPARLPVTGSFRLLDADTVGFSVGSYDPALPLVIDPVVYSTYLGGSGKDNGNAIDVDSAEATYVAGVTASVDFPTTPGALTTACPGVCTGRRAAFVTKFDAQGRLVYSTYLGGTDGDAEATGVAVDGSGRAHVVGTTTSTTFPTANAAQPATGTVAPGGRADAFVSMLANDGSDLVYSTYLGGFQDDAARAVAVDSNGVTFVTGETESANFPFTDGAMAALPPTCATVGGLPVNREITGRCPTDAFVSRYASDGKLTYSTVLGGAAESDFGTAIDVDGANHAYVTGKTASQDFPVKNPVQPTIAGSFDAFVAKLDTTAGQGEDPLVYSTFLGGAPLDEGRGIAVDPQGSAYVAGSGSQFPVVRPMPEDDGLAFVAKLSAAGSALVYSTKLGHDGELFTRAAAVDIDAAGHAYVAGNTADPGLRVADAFQPSFGGGVSDAFVARVDDDGTALSLPFASFLGGGGQDDAFGIAVGATTIHVVGYTDSADFPVMDPSQAGNGGTTGNDAFVVSVEAPTTTTTSSTIPTSSSTTSSSTTSSSTSTSTSSTTSSPTTTSSSSSTTSSSTVPTGGATSTTGITSAPSTTAAGGAAPVSPGTGGYTLVGSDGGVFPFGDSRFFGSTGGIRLARPVVGLQRSRTGSGYWVVASDGGVFAFGDARFLGSTGALRLAQPIVGMERTPTGNGYWLVASDGGVFAFGDAGFFGSTGAIRLARPVVGLRSTPSGKGYWLVASDGGVFAFGDARFLGSTGAARLSQPVVGAQATPSGNGYWLVASDGGVFAFGDAVFRGSTGGVRLAAPIVAMAATPSGSGYWVCAGDGGVFAFGGAGFRGSMGASRLNAPIVGCA